MSDERNSLCRGFYLLFGASLLTGSMCLLDGLLELVTEMAGKGGGFCRPHRRESETCICLSVCLSVYALAWAGGQWLSTG